MKVRQSLSVIECKGSDYEIGVQYGEAAMDNIKQSIDMVSKKNFIRFLASYLLRKVQVVLTIPYYFKLNLRFTSK
jgi:hypothetical protein